MNKIFYGIGAKNRMLENATQNPITQKVFITFKNKNDQHNFTYFQDWQTFLKYRNKFNTNKKSIINEIIKDGLYCKAYLDIELILDDINKYEEQKKLYLDNIIKDTIEIFDTEYNKRILREDFKILDSSGIINDKFKLSLHIIIAPKDINILFKTNRKHLESSVHHFYKLLLEKNKVLYTNKIIDETVYSIDREFRMIYSYKNTQDTRQLIPLNNKTYKPIKNLTNTEILQYMITYYDPSITIKIIKTPIITINKLTTKQDIIQPTNNIYKDHILKLVKKYYTTAFYVNFNNDFYVYDYDHNNTCIICNRQHTRSKIYVFENERGLYLGCFRNTEQKIHLGYLDIDENYKINCHDVSRQYLLSNDIKLIDINQDIIKSIITKWIDTLEYKTLCIKSPMGTGKTTITNQICSYKNKFKKILWITHRKTLTHNIYGSFVNLGFQKYLDIQGSLFKYDKIICQIDSLYRLQMDDEYVNYDLIIIDEIESILHHISSPFLDNPQQNKYARNIFNLMTHLIQNCKKLLVLDADYHDRASLYIQYFGKSIMINNTYKPSTKIFKMTQDKDKFNNLLYKDIFEDKLNVCIISMSSDKLVSYHDYFTNNNITNKYYTSNTDDKDKELLQNVNEEWIKYQVVSYSPTIEAGVDFNIEHFDKMYCIISAGFNTTSQRAFLQMTGRIRKLKNNNIICLCQKNIRMKFDSPIYTISDVYASYKTREKFMDLDILKYKSINNENTNTIDLNINNLDIYDYINIYNQCEIYNKNQSIFMTILKRLIENKGHELIIEDDIKKIMEENKEQEVNEVNEENINIKAGKEIIINEWLKISLVDNEFMYNDIMYNIDDINKKKNMNGNLNENEKLIINYSYFIKYWGINNLDNKELLKKFINDHYNKNYLLPNYYNNYSNKNYLSNCHDFYNNLTKYNNNLDIININIVDLLNKKNNNKLTTKEEQQKTKLKLLHDILKKLLVDNIDINMVNGHIITYDKITNIKNNILKNSEYFKNEKYYRLLFSFDKIKRKDINNISLNTFLANINMILGSCNLSLVRSKKVAKTIKKNKYYNYIITINKLYDDIYKFKNKLYDNYDNLEFKEINNNVVTDYKPLFKNNINN